MRPFDRENSKYISYDADGNMLLPNIKQLFLPDEGKELMDADLSGADAMVYGAESKCKNLTDFFANPKKKHPSGKLYAWVASEHLQREVSPDEDIYKLYKASHHGVWYGMREKKLAATLGCSEGMADTLMRFYDYIYPEKEIWHKRLREEIKKRGYVSNVFGRRAFFLNTNDPLLWNKVFAWIPQATIADVINRAWINVAENLNNSILLKIEHAAVFGAEPIEVLMQVHDSLLFQYPIEIAEEVREPIRQAMLIPLPYDPGFSIPSDFKVSQVSYGDCAKLK